LRTKQYFAYKYESLTHKLGGNFAYLGGNKKKTLNLNPFDLSAAPSLKKEKLEKPCFGFLNFGHLL
jgi:hypothetical protein